MKNRVSIMVVTIGLIAMLQSFSSCKPCEGCKGYEAITVEATYCRLHREAVWEYVELTQTPDGIEGRTHSVRRLLDLLHECSSMECIDAEIDADTIAAGFKDIYADAHQQAEGKLNGATVETMKVLLCGLDNGLKDWVDSLKLEVN